MPSGGSGNIRTRITFETVDYNAYTVSIIDLNYTGTVKDMVLDRSAGGCIKSYLSDDKNPLDEIHTMAAKLSFVIKNEDDMTLFQDLSTAEEGRFFMQIKRGSDVEFVGKIVVDEMELRDQHEPPITIRAIDGLTDLKTKPYVHPVSGLAKIREILLGILSNLDTISLYSTSDVFLLCQTNLKANVTFSTTNMWEITKLDDYFYSVQNDKKTPLSCYDVLVEICKKMHCNMSYENGYYRMWGKEGLTEDRTGPYFYYAKNATILTATSPDNTPIDLESALYGGVWRFQAGFNTVKIRTSPEFTNRRQGEGVYRECSLPFVTSHSYVSIGFVQKDQAYKIKVSNVVSNIQAGSNIPSGYDFKITVKITTISSGAFVETDYIMSYTVYNTTFVNYINIASAAADRTVEVKATFVNYKPPGTYDITVLPNKFNYLLYKNEETEIAEFIATIPNSNAKTKEIPILAPDRFGKEFYKFYFHDGSNFTTREWVEEGWRFSSSDAWKGLETSIVKRILGVIRHNTKIYRVSINVKNGMLFYGLKKYTYKEEDYYLKSYEHNLRDDIISASTFIKMDTDFTDIEVLEDIPVATSNFGAVGDVFQDVSTSIVEEFNNVSTNTIELEYDIPDGATYKSMKDSIDCFVDGVRWRMVETLGTIKATYVMDAATNEATLYPTPRNSNVIFKINKNFVIGVSF